MCVCVCLCVCVFLCVSVSVSVSLSVSVQGIAYMLATGEAREFIAPGNRVVIH